MTRDVVVVPPELPLASAWSLMRREHIRHLPVVRGGALIGMLSERDVLLLAKLGSDDAIEVPASIVVGAAMTPAPLTTCDESTDVRDLVRWMTEKKIDAVPVVRGLRLVGLVTSTDLLLLLLERDEARALPFQFRLVEEPVAHA